MKNFIRAYKAVISVPGQTGFEIGEEKDGRPLHISFELEKSDAQANNTGRISIWNLNDEHKSILLMTGCMIELSAGYRDSVAPIFLGTVKEPIETIDGSDRKIEIQVIDGLKSFETLSTICLQGEVTCQTVVQLLLSDMGSPTVVYSKTASENLTKEKYQFGYSYVGKTKEGLRQVCEKCLLKFTIQNGVVQIFSPNEAISNQAYLLDATSGLISIPKKVKITVGSDGKITTNTASASAKSESTISSQNTKKSSKKSKKSSQKTVQKSELVGYEIEFFINGHIQVNDLVQVKSKSLNGLFRVKKVKYKGDNYSGDWKCIATIVEVK